MMTEELEGFTKAHLFMFSGFLWGLLLLEFVPVRFRGVVGESFIYAGFIYSGLTVLLGLIEVLEVIRERVEEETDIDLEETEGGEN